MPFANQVINIATPVIISDGVIAGGISEDGQAESLRLLVTSISLGLIFPISSCVMVCSTAGSSMSSLSVGDGRISGVFCVVFYHIIQVFIAGIIPIIIRYI